MPIHVEDRWVQHPDGRLFCRVWTPADLVPAPSGDTPIVLMHDSLGCVDLWRDFPSMLAAATGRRVIAYDRLGFGRSDARSDRLTLDFVAQEALDYFCLLREQLGFDRFVALGHSVGGGMAVECAATYPEACDALVTLAAQVFAEDRTLSSIREARVQFQDPTQVQRLAKYHGDKARWVIDAWTESWLHPDFARWNLLEVLPLVTCPVLVLHGEHDEYGSSVHPTLIGDKTSGPSRVELMADTAHVPHRERPEAVVSMLTEFLAAHS